MEQKPDFTNFYRWEEDTTQFIKDTQGFPKPQSTPIQVKNKKIAELLEYVSTNTKVDRSYLISQLTQTLLVGQ